MDYAKLALLQADQIENTGGEKQQIYRAGLNFDCNVAMREVLPLCSISGQGTVGIIVSLSFDGEKGSVIGSDELLFGGKVVYKKFAALTQVFMLSAEVTKTTQLAFSPTFLRHLTTAEVMVIGGTITGTSVGEVALAQAGGCLVACTVSGGEVRVSCSAALPDLGEYVVAGFGSCASVAAIRHGGQDAFGVVFIDGGGNLFLTVLALDGEFITSVSLGKKASSASLIYSGGQVVVGYCYGGYAYAAALSDDYQTEVTLKIEEAAGIDFVRSCDPPIAILNKKSSFVLRLPQDEIPSKDTVSTKITCEVG